MKPTEQQQQLNKEAVTRIGSAVGAGVKIQRIADLSGISHARISSTINKEAYRFTATFNDDEIAAINDALDTIKAAL